MPRSAAAPCSAHLSSHPQETVTPAQPHPKIGVANTGPSRNHKPGQRRFGQHTTSLAIIPRSHRCRAVARTIACWWPNAQANLPGPLQRLHAARSRNAAKVKLSDGFDGSRGDWKLCFGFVIYPAAQYSATARPCNWCRYLLGLRPGNRQCQRYCLGVRAPRLPFFRLPCPNF